MLCLLVADMNSTAGLGPVAAIGVARRPRWCMLTLLPALLVICGRWVFWPVRPTLGSRRADRDRLLGPRGRAIAAAPGGVDRHRARCSLVAGARHAQLERQRPDHKRVLPRHAGVGHRRGGARRRTSPPAAGNPVDVLTSADHGGRGAAAVAAAPTASTRGRASRSEGRPRTDRGARSPTPPTARPPTTPSTELRTALDDVGDGEALVGGNTAINLDVQTRLAATTTG